MRSVTCARCGKPLSDGQPAAPVAVAKVVRRPADAAGGPEDGRRGRARIRGNHGSRRPAEPQPEGDAQGRRRAYASLRRPCLPGDDAQSRAHPVCRHQRRRCLSPPRLSLPRAGRDLRRSRADCLLARGLGADYPLRRAIRVTVEETRSLISPIYWVTGASEDEVIEIWERKLGYKRQTPRSE